MSVTAVDDDYRPGPVRLRALTEIDGFGTAAGGSETLSVPPGMTFSFEPGLPGNAWLMSVAYRFVVEGKAEVVGTRPGWLPKLQLRMRALGPCATPVGERNHGDVFDLPWETRAERELLLWGISGGRWELIGEPPPTWPVGHIRSTGGGGAAAY